MQGNWSPKWQYTHLDYGKVWLRPKRKENPTLLIVSSVLLFFQAVGETSHGEKEKLQFSISVKELVGRLWQGLTYRSYFFKSPSVGDGKEGRWDFWSDYCTWVGSWLLFVCLYDSVLIIKITNIYQNISQYGSLIFPISQRIPAI